MKIAVVGGGISGLMAAHLLGRRHGVTVFEAGAEAGGHTHTVDVAAGEKTYAVDTGFIVYNERTYPAFTRLLRELNVATQPSEMSFSVSCEASGVEYGGASLDTFFAQRRNLLNLRFYAMLRDILRFSKRAQTFLRGAPGDDVTLGNFLRDGAYSRAFSELYLIPMGAAVWSAEPRAMLEFPARMFCQFFENHGFLDLDDRPQWRVICGGSREYVRKLVATFGKAVRTHCPVRSLRRRDDGVEISTETHGTETFDHVVLACHSDQALRLLADPSAAESDILAAIRYRANDVVLHTDASLMPRSRRVWSAWNYFLPRRRADAATVTYNMNILQGLDAPEQFLVTLNDTERIRPERILRRFAYDHPIFDPPALAAQARRSEISGAGRTHYCGAYWRNGFHEDGVQSAIDVAQCLGEIH